VTRLLDGGRKVTYGSRAVTVPRKGSRTMRELWFLFAARRCVEKLVFGVCANKLSADGHVVHAGIWLWWPIPA